MAESFNTKFNYESLTANIFDCATELKRKEPKHNILLKFHKIIPVSMDILITTFIFDLNTIRATKYLNGECCYKDIEYDRRIMSAIEYDGHYSITLFEDHTCIMKCKIWTTPEHRLIE